MAIGPSTASTMSARLISCACLESENPPPAPRTLRRSPAGGELSHQFLCRRKREACLAGELGRAEARARGPAGGSGHQDDRIIGKVAQAHFNSELSSRI